MKKGHCIKLRGGLGLIAVAALVVAVVLTILPTRAWAVVTCPTTSTADSDNDGFTDAQECNGIDLDLGTASPGHFPSCAGTTLNRGDCLDPNTKDLFVILVPATPTSLIPSDPLRFISSSQSAGGLGIAAHMLTPDQVGSMDSNDRRVTSASPQKAGRITESSDPTGDILGFCNYGTPNNLDDCTVFTQRIKNFVESVCAGATVCADTTGVVLPELTNLYIRHTITHECGHSLALATDYNSRFGGYHYRSGTDVVMEQAITYKVKGSNVTFNISTVFTDPDKTGATLK